MHTKPRPLILSGWSSQHYAARIAEHLGTRCVKVAGKQFDDKEIQTTLQENVRGREVVVVASAAGDPNKQEKETRLLMRAARRSGASTVTLLLPYMWYGRSDDNWDDRNAPALTDTIETLRVHCDNAVIVDPHNHGMTREKFLDAGSPVKTCATLHFGYPFAVQLKDLFNRQVLSKENLIFSHADGGSAKRISRSFRRALYNVLDYADRNPDQDDWAQGMKDRDKMTGKIRFKGISADVAGKDVAIFEDMIASGGTACDLAALLKDHGARSVTLFATAGLLTTKPGDARTAAVDRLDASRLDAVFIANTYDHRGPDPDIHQAIERSPVIHVIETDPFVAAILGALHTKLEDDASEDDNSISAYLSGTHAEQRADSQTVARATPLKKGSPLLTLAR